MLRVNLMTDPEFRKDILDMTRSILKEVGQSIIVETIKAEGWLESKVMAYLNSQPMHKHVESYLNQNRGWHTHSDFVNFLNKLIDARIEVEVKKMAEKVVTAAKILINESIREIIKDELKKRFS